MVEGRSSIRDLLLFTGTQELHFQVEEDAETPKTTHREAARAVVQIRDADNESILGIEVYRDWLLIGVSLTPLTLGSVWLPLTGQ